MALQKNFSCRLICHLLKLCTVFTHIDQHMKPEYVNIWQVLVKFTKIL